MRISGVVASACLIAALTAPSETLPSTLPKDRAAMMIYEGRDRVVALLPSDTANLALIILAIREDTTPVAQSQLAGRPCIGLALFSNKEWAALTAGGRDPSEVRPSEAAMRLRVYPARAGAHAVVENIQAKVAYEATGLEWLQNPPPPKTRADSARPAVKPLKWSVQARLDSARGPCSVE